MFVNTILVFISYLCGVKRALKYILRTLLALVLLIVLLAASLYLPPVQRWAVKKLTAYLEEQTGLEVSIGSVHLSPLLDLSLGQVHIAKPPTDVIDVYTTIYCNLECIFTIVIICSVADRE